MTSWAPTIDFPYRGLVDQCHAQYSGEAIDNRMMIVGAMVGGPTDNDVYVDVRSDYVAAEPTQDYTAAFSGALAKLIEYYQQDPYCDNISDLLGWNHANATSGNWSPRNQKWDQAECQANWKVFSGNDHGRY